VAADKALATGKAGDKGLTPENAAKTVRKSAEVQGRLALAVLGQRWFDEVRGLQREDYEQVKRRLGDFLVGEKWWLAVDRVGEEIGRRVRELPARIFERRQEARKFGGSKATAALQDADRLTRLLDGASSLFIGDKEDRSNPANAYRKALAQ